MTHTWQPTLCLSWVPTGPKGTDSPVGCVVWIECARSQALKGSCTGPVLKSSQVTPQAHRTAGRVLLLGGLISREEVGVCIKVGSCSVTCVDRLPQLCWCMCVCAPGLHTRVRGPLDAHSWVRTLWSGPAITCMSTTHARSTDPAHVLLLTAADRSPAFTTAAHCHSLAPLHFADGSRPFHAPIIRPCLNCERKVSGLVHFGFCW